MPELPEVETVVRTIYPHIRDCVFNDAQLLRASSLHPLSLPLSTLKGMRISSASRRGKLIVLGLARPDTQRKSQSAKIPQMLVAHLRMTGRLFAAEANLLHGSHTRCIFAMRRPDGSDFQLFFDDTRAFGQIMVATDEILHAWKFWRELGPEPLEIDATQFSERLKGSRAIKAALLDQRVIAGIGNIYADEALFQAAILPDRSTGSLSFSERGVLLAAIQDILKRSISQCGSSIRDYLDADGNAGAFQNTFMAYGRGGQQCARCGTILQKSRIGGRATVFCPGCQK